MAIFERNLTSELIDSAISSLKLLSKSSCLDLGCGDGNILRSVAQKKDLIKISGSDYSEESILQAKHLATKANINADYRVGHLLDPWVGSKFDLVSCDVAAVSATIAKKSDWYAGVSCNTGEDGLSLVSDVLDEIRQFLNPGGIFIIPMLSLANTELLYSKVNQIFNNVECVSSKIWPMPEKLIDKIQNENLPLTCQNWEIKKNFGIFTAKTSILKCYN
tara:strand:- start:6161 stop:6817 length:657 start_codon:yes stop_codon:yes gene_type:complete